MAPTPTPTEFADAILSPGPNWRDIPARSAGFFNDKGQPLVDNLPSINWANEVYSELANQLISRKVNDLRVTNPLSFLETTGIDFGAYMSECGVRPIAGHTFRDPGDKSSQFKFRPALVDSSVTRINREMQYRISIEQRALKQAFRSLGDMNAVLGQMYALPAKAKTRQDYIYAKFLIYQTLVSSQSAIKPTQVIEVPDIRGNQMVDIKSIINFVKIMLNTLKTMERNTPHFNAMQRAIAATREEMHCLIDFQALTSIQTDARSQIYHPDELDTGVGFTGLEDFSNLSELDTGDKDTLNTYLKNLNTKVQPSDIIACLTSRNAFGYHDVQPIETSMSVEAQRLYSTFFHTSFQMYHVSPFAPVVYFVTPGTRKKLFGNDVDKVKASGNGVIARTNDKAVRVEAGKVDNLHWSDDDGENPNTTTPASSDGIAPETL